jgi:23S rRNA (guanine745-N1)-methyltransferase
VNLLVGGRLPGGASGDSDDMVRARREVFDAGCYEPIIAAVAAAVERLGARTVLDAGCGEGTYLARACGADAEGCGIDISKAAVRRAARRHGQQRWAVASSYRLPFADGSFDALLSVFSPRPYSEFSRVLAPGGAAVVVTPGPEHLRGLAEMLYAEARPHELDADAPPFESVERVRFTVDLEQAVLRRALVEMTPYWWSATPERRERVERDLRSVEADMVLAVMRRNPEG